MQENDFEKQVHQKMGALRVLPSETVWEQVEMHLRRKEKRRRWIIWFPLLLTGLSLFGYFSFYPGHTVLSNESTGFSHNPSQKLTNRNDAPRSPNGESIPEDYNKITNPVDLKSGKTGFKPIGTTSLNDKGLKSNDISTAVKQEAVPEVTVKISTLASTRPANRSVVIKSVAGSNTAKDNSGQLNGLSTKEIPYPATAPAERTYSTAAVEKEPPVNGNAAAELEPADVYALPLIKAAINTSFTSPKENLLVKITSRHRENTGWAWGLSFLGGRSSITNGSFNKIFSGTADNFSSPNQFTNGNLSGNRLFTEPFPTRADAGFSVGTFLKKRLSARFSISLGLNYTVLATTTRVGKRIDSVVFVNSGTVANRQAVNGYFRIGDAGSYTNKYHYIEMPVMLQTTLTKNWKLPVYWDFGFSVSRLLTSNALHFDNVTGVYFQGNQLASKTQVNVITGLPLKLSSKKKFDLQVGPQLQYGLSNVLATQKTSGKHFLFGALKANLSLGKK